MEKAAVLPGKIADALTLYLLHPSKDALEDDCDSIQSSSPSTPLDGSAF
jgi:hypothetical protein